MNFKALFVHKAHYQLFAKLLATLQISSLIGLSKLNDNSSGAADVDDTISAWAIMFHNSGKPWHLRNLTVLPFILFLISSEL